MFSLLSFDVVMYNDDLVQMMKKESSITWFKEWLLYFQWEWVLESTILPQLKDFFKASESTISRVLWHTLPTMLEMSRNEPCSCSFAAGWRAPRNYGLERFPTRHINTKRCL
jgi:hypothetical protein